MPTRVAYLGPQGTYGQKAAHALVELEKIDSPEFVPCVGLRSVIENAATKRCDIAVVPIENSVEGGVTETLDSLWRNSDLYIRRALVLPIRHALLSNGKLTEISEVLSHPQALAQCSNWLHEYLPNALLLPTNSTAEAVKMVVGSKFRAAIASRSPENNSNLNEIAYPINDVAGNCTRFVLLQAEYVSQQGNLSSIAFSLNSNSPGALLEALTCIANLGLNMSRIESRPSKRELGEYVFFIDLELPNKPKLILNELYKKLSTLCEHFVDFGCYPSSEMNLL